jgi:hypothetical protein
MLTGAGSTLVDHPCINHVFAEMSLRYGRLFDTTVRAQYQRALDLAKANIGPLPQGPKRIPLTIEGDWQQAPAIKARLAGGYCLRAPAPRACPYANVCGTQSWCFALGWFLMLVVRVFTGFRDRSRRLVAAGRRDRRASRDLGPSVRLVCRHVIAVCFCLSQISCDSGRLLPLGVVNEICATDNA